MNIWKKRIPLILLALAWLNLPAHSQEGNPLQFISGVSQSALANPAFQNETEQLVVGLPLLSGVWIDWNANFSMDYIFSQNFEYSFDHFYNELGKPGEELGTALIPILYLSLKNDNQNFSFSVSDRIFTKSHFDHEILKFIDQGLSPFYGNETEYGPVSSHIFHYREIAFGWSKQIWKGFYFGVRPKVLFGRLYYDMTDIHFSVKTDSDNGQLLLEPSGAYRIAGPFDVSYNETLDATTIRPNPDITDYFFNFRNLGAAVDFGISYRKQNTEFSVSVTDLGFLTFKHKTYDVEFTDALHFGSGSLYQSSDNEKENYKEPKIALQELMDSIPYVITARPVTERMIEQIPVKLNATVKQKVTDKTKVGFSGQLTYFDSNIRNFLTGFMHTRLGDRFNMAGSITLLDFEKVLPGVGASYTARNAQFYLSANNITALVKPSSAKYLNLCFGVNFLFSTRQK